MTAALVAPSASPPDDAGPDHGARPGLRVVEVPRRSRTGLYAASIVLVLFCSLFLNAGFHTVLVSGQQRLDTLHGQVVAQEKANERLRLLVAGLESPARIVEEAKRNDMVLPAEVRWLSPGPGPGSAIASTSKLVPPPTTSPGVDATNGADGSSELAAGQTPIGGPGASTTVPVAPGGR